MKQIIVDAEYPRDCPYRTLFSSKEFGNFFVCGKTIHNKRLLMCESYANNKPIFPEDCPFEDVEE